MKSISIFIKSYPADFKYLKYCLMSIEKYATGYNKIVLVVPPGSLMAFSLADVHTAPNTIIREVSEECGGYIWQQYIKLTAHHYTDSDYIMYVDSDCVFNRSIDVLKLVENNKPTMLHTPYSMLVDNNGIAVTPWQLPTEQVFEREVEFEFMRRNFLIYHRSTLENFEKWMEKKMGMSLKGWCKDQGQMSEFNLLGCYAWLYEHDKYNWINTAKESFPPETGDQYWSHGDKNGDKHHQDEYHRSIDIINKALGLNVTEL